MSIKKIRITLTYTTGFIYFIGLQLVSAADTGEKATLIEGLAVGLFIFGLLYVLFSDWMYYNHLIDKGAKIKYETYQKFGLATVIVFLCLIGSTVYNDLYNGELGILSLLIESVLIYIFIVTIFSDKKSHPRD